MFSVRHELNFYMHIFFLEEIQSSKGSSEYLYFSATALPLGCPKILYSSVPILGPNVPCHPNAIYAKIIPKCYPLQIKIRSL
jgi:hypothetical protein